MAMFNHHERSTELSVADELNDKGGISEQEQGQGEKQKSTDMTDESESNKQVKRQWHDSEEKQEDADTESISAKLDEVILKLSELEIKPAAEECVNDVIKGDTDSGYMEEVKSASSVDSG